MEWIPGLKSHSRLGLSVQTVDATPSGIKLFSKVVFMKQGKRFGLSAEQRRAEQSSAEQSSAAQSSAEQSRAEQSRAEQSRAEQKPKLFEIKGQ